MGKIEGLVEKWRAEAQKALDSNKSEPYPWYRVEADTLDACADELEAAVKADAASVGPPPTAPLGGGCGLLRDVEGFSTEGLMEQKKAETRREAPDAEAARLWRLLEEAYNKGTPVWKTEGGQFMAEVFDGESFLILPFDTLDKALDAWDTAKKGDSTTNEYKPSPIIDFEQGGHKGK